MSSFANLIAKCHDLGVTIRRVFGEVWSIQTQFFKHLCDNESRAYEVWIGGSIPHFHSRTGGFTSVLSLWLF